MGTRSKKIIFLPMKEDSVNNIALRHSLELRDISDLKLLTSISSLKITKLKNYVLPKYRFYIWENTNSEGMGSLKPLFRVPQTANHPPSIAEHLVSRGTHWKLKGNLYPTLLCCLQDHNINNWNKLYLSWSVDVEKRFVSNTEWFLCFVDKTIFHLFMSWIYNFFLYTCKSNIKITVSNRLSLPSYKNQFKTKDQIISTVSVFLTQYLESHRYIKTLLNHCMFLPNTRFWTICLRL